MVAHRFPNSKSILSDTALAQCVQVAYHLSGVRCQLLTATMRDVYLVTSPGQHYILYVYRAGQRTVAEIEAEWQFVDFLKANDVPVAPAIRTHNGLFWLSFEAPEGRRYGVLSPFVEGDHLRQRPSLEASRSYGQIIAKLHTLADRLPESLPRPANDPDFLLNQSVIAFEAEATDRPADVAYVRQAAAELYSKLEALPRDKPLYGLIHG